MDETLSKTGNGFHKTINGTSKNRLRIHGLATLERENHPSITASYDYTTLGADDFFEEDVNELQYFELNKIAMGMTIYKKDQSPSKLKIKNGLSEHSNSMKNGTSLLALQDFENRSYSNPILTDVIWSRMDIINPNANRNAYIIKQYYNSKNPENRFSHAEKCNNFVCGFVSCCLMMGVGCALGFLYHSINTLSF